MKGEVVQTYSRGTLTIGDDYLAEREPFSVADARARLRRRGELISQLKMQITQLPKLPVNKAKRAQLVARQNHLESISHVDKNYLVRVFGDRFKLDSDSSVDGRLDPIRLLAKAFTCLRRLESIPGGMDESSQPAFIALIADIDRCLTAALEIAQ